MINRITNEINSSIENGNFLVALISALSLPNICGKAEYGNIGNSSRYKKRYSEYIGKYETDNENDDLPCPTADIVCDLRCSLICLFTPDVDKNKVNFTKFKLISTGNFMDGGFASIGVDKRELEINVDNLIGNYVELQSIIIEIIKINLIF